MNLHQQLVRIKAVHQNLGDLQDQVVYVGGATISLYADRQTLEIRPTDDIDILLEILNYTERANLEEKLRKMGFQHDMTSGVVCRYTIQGILVDIMPTDDPSIGFQNKWYPEGFRTAVDFVLDNTTSIKILSAPYLIATKLEAFKSRGGGDGRTSHDFEDIVFLFENRSKLWEEMDQLSGGIREYLISEFDRLLRVPHFFEWVDCHVEQGSRPASYQIVEKLRNFVGPR